MLLLRPGAGPFCSLTSLWRHPVCTLCWKLEWKCKSVLKCQDKEDVWLWNFSISNRTWAPSDWPTDRKKKSRFTILFSKMVTSLHFRCHFFSLTGYTQVPPVHRKQRRNPGFSELLQVPPLRMQKQRFNYYWKCVKSALAPTITSEQGSFKNSKNNSKLFQTRSKQPLTITTDNSIF